jgi:hypothetical protein
VERARQRAPAPRELGRALLAFHHELPAKNLMRPLFPVLIAVALALSP